MLKHFEAICGSKFWDDGFYFNKNPNFTPCFQNTVIQFIPIITFWIALPFWIYMLTKKSICIIHASWLFICKIMLTCILISVQLFSIFDFFISEKQPIVHILSPLILTITYGFVLFTIHHERLNGLRSSSLLFSFWLLSFLASLIFLRSAIIKFIEINQFNLMTHRVLVLDCVETVVILFELILSAFTDKCQHDSKCNKNISLLSRQTYWWINTFIYNGYKRPITKDDFWPIDESDSSGDCTKRLAYEWDIAIKKYNLIKEKPINESKIKFLPDTKTRPFKGPSLGFCICKAFFGKFLAASLFRICVDGLQFLGPLFLDKIINFVKDQNQSTFTGYFFVILMFSCSVIQTICNNNVQTRLLMVSSRVSSACMGLIYRKAMVLSSSARRQSTIGEMVNLLSENSQVFRELLFHLYLLWNAPLQLIICIILLWRYLGAASLAGLATMLTLLPINALISNKSKFLLKKRHRFHDNRIKIISEALNMIKIVKFYAWEMHFSDIISKIKENELKIFSKIGVLNSIASFSSVSIPFLVAAVSFATFILIDENNVLDSNTAFVSLSLFNIMKNPLTNTPNLIASIIQTNVALERIRNFLMREEIDEHAITNFEDAKYSIKIEECTFGWDSNYIESAQLKNLNLNVEKNKLIAVIGPIACGKSSLLSSILNEMHKFNGNINVYGTIAYVPQIAWIQNATIKENILFASNMDQDLYYKCLEACALIDDINLFESKDETEIGEKGVNLSGGQKARINLARAVYSNADIYLLDDPLSAVDMNVSQHIFKNVIGSQGILKNKTRLFVTNSLNYLPLVDEVIILDNGKIAEIGKYEDLMSKKEGTLWNFINSNKTEKEMGNQNKLLSQKTSVTSSKIIEFKANKEIGITKNKKKNGKLIMDEHIQTGKVKLNVLWNYFQACRLWFAIPFGILYILANVSLIGSNIFLSDWSNEARKGSSVKYSRNLRLIVFTLIGLGQGIFILIGDLVYIKMSLNAAILFHSSMLKSILQSTLEFFEQTPIGRIVNRFNRDIDAVEKNIPDSFKPLIKLLLQILGTVLVISFNIPLFAIPTVFLLALYFTCQRFFVATSRQVKRIESASRSPIYSHFGESLTGMNVIRSCNRKTLFLTKMFEFIDRTIAYNQANIFTSRWLGFRLETCGNLFTLLACIFVIINRNTISPGDTGMIISLTLSVTNIMAMIVRRSAEFESNITSVERLTEYQNTPHEEPWEIQETKPEEKWPVLGSIKFVNYSVKYKSDLEFALKNINCEIKPGEKIGIVGRTGAGKSSLTLALFRMLKHVIGDIYIDDVNIKIIGLHDLRKKLTIIPQDPIIFSGTLKLNIDPFNEYSDEIIWNALEQANLKDFVFNLDKKLLFECSEGGENLSVGQRQLICLVRALLRKTKILILDEATASVDHNTDDHIQRTIRKSFNDCTVLTIAHRINTIMDNDRVMVLDKGEIIEFDTPSNLLNDKNSNFFILSKSS